MLSRDSTIVLQDYDILKNTYIDVPFDYKFPRAIGAQVVVSVGDTVYCLRNIDGNSINPYKHGLRSHRAERCSTYDVYTMSTDYNVGTYGGKVLYHGNNAQEFDGDIFVRMTYHYNIVNGVKLLRLLDKRKSKFAVRDIVMILRAMLNKVVKIGIGAVSLTRDLDEEDRRSAESYLERLVGEEMLMDIGVNVSDIHLEIESVTSTPETREATQEDNTISNHLEVREDV